MNLAANARGLPHPQSLLSKKLPGTAPLAAASVLCTVHGSWLRHGLAPRCAGDAPCFPVFLARAPVPGEAAECPEASVTGLGTAECAL